MLALAFNRSKNRTTPRPVAAQPDILRTTETRLGTLACPVAGAAVMASAPVYIEARKNTAGTYNVTRLAADTTARGENGFAPRIAQPLKSETAFETALRVLAGEELATQTRHGIFGVNNPLDLRSAKAFIDAYDFGPGHVFDWLQKNPARQDTVLRGALTDLQGKGFAAGLRRAGLN